MLNRIDFLLIWLLINIFNFNKKQQLWDSLAILKPL
jgi:hypothetical protein